MYLSKNQFIDAMMMPTRQPKDRSIQLGYSFEQNGKLYYVDGKYCVCLSEHFANTKKSVTDLVENTIRYEAGKAG
jgi:hypothetical protein